MNHCWGDATSGYHARVGLYYQTPPPGEEEHKPPGCLDTLFIIRIVLGVLFWPLAAMIFVLADLALIFYALTTNPILVVIPVGLTAVALLAFARWEATRERPPDYGSGPPT
jgi:hypothetical protein